MPTDEITDVETRKYELMVALDPTGGDSGFLSQYEELKKLIAEAGGSIFFEDMIGLRNAAYRIRKHVKGYYAAVGFDCPTRRVRDIDHALRLNGAVLRHLIVILPNRFELKTVKEYEAAAEMMGRGKAKEKKQAPKDTLLEKVEEDLFAGKSGSEKASPEREREAHTTLPATESYDKKLEKILENPDLGL